MILTNLFLLNSDGWNLGDAVFGHGRRASAVHLVQQLSDDGIQAGSTESVITRIAVHEPAILIIILKIMNKLFIVEILKILKNNLVKII